MSSHATHATDASTKAAAGRVYHGPATKTKYTLPPVETQPNLIGLEGSPIKQRANEEFVTLHRVVTDHGIITVTNKYGESGFIHNIRKASLLP